MRGGDFLLDADESLETRGLARPLFPFRMILDVGANVGQSALRFGAAFPGAVIHCFEPVARANEALRRNVAHLTQVQIHQIGMAETPRRATMFVGTETALASAVVRGAGTEGEEVELSTIDDFCREHEIDEIDLLKIDTEGYDLLVLKGAAETLRARRVRFVQAEACGGGPDARGFGRFISLEDLVWELSLSGYELFGIYEQMPQLDGRRSLGYFNAVFVSPELLK